MVSAILKSAYFELRPSTLFATCVLFSIEVLSLRKKLDSTFFIDSIILLIVVKFLLTDKYRPALLRSY